MQQFASAAVEGQHLDFTGGDHSQLDDITLRNDRFDIGFTR